MSYEDAAQNASPATDTGPIARPDVDALPPGSFGPATGNIITGAGTASGASGADTVGTPPGAITEVHGAGGQTTVAGDTFQAAGQYGVLSIDTQGNFNYVRNPGTPDGVKDVFGYTLADAQGAHASSALTIDIGQLPAAVADSIVNLPAGVELSDIHVVGRDLVIDMPDGTQMVIPGGAVFVPQLMIGDVAVPASNVAALLIDSEPQPAAGPPPSSGGNFASDVPPLDPGVPLGDLIPPTELVFTPPEFEQVGQFVNHQPTILIETPDNPAGAIDASESVDEKGLPPRGAESPGSGEIADGNATNNSDTSETNTGTITFTAVDGLDNVTINGVAVTGVGQQIQGQFGVLTITGIADGAITYSYTLTDNTNGDATQDVFAVVVTDSDGDKATGSLTVHIVDDVPTAHDDTGTQGPNGGPITVNVLANDVPGADGVTNDHVAFVAGSLTGSGTLVYNNDGTFTYTPSAGESGTITYQYQITDGDGDTSIATVTITLNPDSTPTISVAGDNSVDEAALPVGSNPSSTAETATGSININSPDGVSKLVINGVDVTNGGTVHGADGLLTVTHNADGTYSYSYTLSGPTPNDAAGDNFSVTVTDSDGDQASTTLHITIVDDVPTAHDDVGTESAENAPVTVNVLANDVPGADGVTDNHVALVTGSLTGSGSLVYNNDGTFTYTPSAGETGDVTFQYQITDGDGDTSTATVTIHLTPDSTPTVDVSGDQSVDEAGLPVIGSHAGDGSATTTGSIDITTGNDTLGSLVINGTDVTNGGTVNGADGVLTVTHNSDGTYSYSYTLTTPTTDGPGTESDNFNVVVTDSDGSTSSTSLNIAIVDDVPTAHDDSATQSTENAPVTVDVLANDIKGADGVANDHVAAVDGTLTGAGTLVYNNDGTFTYTPAAGEQGDVTFQYTITDGDGDTSTATVTIHLQPDSTPTVDVSGDQSVDEAGLPVIGSHAGDGSATTTGSIDITTGGDTVGSLVINGTDVTNGGTVNGADGVLTVTHNSDGTYSYSYTLTTPTTDGPGTESDNFNVVVTDSDGDQASTSLNIAIVDDVPTAHDDSATQSPENAPVTVDVLANDTPGADGVTDAHVAFVDGTLTGSGSLVYNNDGTFTYTPSAGESGDVTFQYQITDGDGDTSTATVTIHLQPDSVPAPDNATASVDDEGLAGGIVGGTGDIVVPNTDGDNNESTFGGTLNGNFGNDTPGTFTFAGMDGTTGTVGQETVLYSWNGTTDVLTATVDGGARDGTVLFTVTLNPSTGAYEVALAENVLQVNDGTNTENNATTDLTFTATDSDGSHTDATLTITFNDDIPTATNEAPQSVAEDATLSGTFDFSGGADHGTITAINGTTLVFGQDGFSQAVALSNGSIVVKADGSYVFTPTDPTNGTATVTGTFTVTDADGDHATATFEFDVTDSHVPTAGTSTVSVDDEGLPNGIPGGTGDIVVPNTDGDNNESTNSGTLNFAFGGDGAGTVTFAGMDGTTGTVGQETVLYSWNAGTDTLTATVDGGARDGTVLFTVTVNPTTGAYEIALAENVLQVNDGTNTENNATTDLTFTVTDSDGSHTDGTLTVTFNDDIPTVIVPESITTTDEAQSTITAFLDTPDHSVTDNFGADGPGSITFANITNGMDSGFSSGGVEITYWLSADGQTLEGRTGSTDGTDGTLIFTVHIDQATSQYDFTLNGTIDNGAGVSFDNLTSTNAGNSDYNGVGADSTATPVDLLISGTQSNGTIGTINTDATAIGVANQSMDAGETVRIDFVTGLTSNVAGTGTGFGFSGHATTNAFVGLIPQVQGAQSTTVSFTVYALSSTLTQTGTPDSNPTGGFSDSTIEPVTTVFVQDFLTGNTATLDISSLAVGSTTAVGFGISVTKNADGSVTFSGVQEGDHYGVGTGSNSFNAIAVHDVSGSFDIGTFALSHVNTGEPLSLNFDLQITDADGDTVPVPGAIDITLNPAGTSNTSTINTSSTLSTTNSTSTLISSNDNNHHGSEKSFGTGGNNAAVIGAIAAAGLSGLHLDAGIHHGITGDTGGSPQLAPLNTGSASPSGVDPVIHEQLAHVVEIPLATGAAASSPQGGAIHQVLEEVQATLGDFKGHTAAALPGGSEMPAFGHSHGPAVAPLTATGIIMPSAQQLAAAANQAGQPQGTTVAGSQPQSNQVVSQVLADSLQGGHGPTANVDALINSLPAHGGSESSLSTLASLGHMPVSFGHTSFVLGSAGGHGAPLMEQMIAHQDAPPVHG